MGDEAGPIYGDSTVGSTESQIQGSRFCLKSSSKSMKILELEEVVGGE